MNESGKKSYEIAYALWRVSEHMEQEVFADQFFEKAIALVIYSADNNYAGALTVVDSLEIMIKFAVDVNCISVDNAAILAREIGNLKSAIADTIGAEEAGTDIGKKDVNISDIFSAAKPLQPVQKEYIPSIEKVREQNSENHASENLQNEPVSQESGKRAEMRQSAIIEKIRQSGNCRLGDIQTILPDTSDRTLRYDLESLVQRNIIERFGPGGRAVYYRMK